MRHLVVLVPRELLGEKPVDAGSAQDLRERTRVAEHVGQPGVAGLDAELVQVETLAVDDLADERLA